MYRHLLVPLDDSSLTVTTVGRAVEFARSLDAKVTFLHARADYGSTSIAALERVLSPAAFNDGVAGESRGILAKAQVVAQTAGVPCDCVVVTSDRPYEAIVDTARARGCDLIFMASHGRRGLRSLMLGSQTQKVLQNTTIPVLVSSVAGKRPMQASWPLATIIDEHRSIAAVIRARAVVATMREQSSRRLSAPEGHAVLHQGLPGDAAPLQGRCLPVREAAQSASESMKRSRSRAPARQATRSRAEQTLASTRQTRAADCRRLRRWSSASRPPSGRTSTSRTR
jgi:nucleotide-binding universal stress UspA family protein